MDFIPVNSSNIEGVYHDGEDLFLKFHRGGVYRYLDVPSRVADEMVDAESVGRYFHAYVKGVYEEQKVGA